MIKSVVIQNFGPLTNIKWKDLGKINVIFGENCSGKTFLMKSLYTAVKSLESYKRGNDNRCLGEILANNLYWTFQVPKLGNIVTKSQPSPLYFEISIENKCFNYVFGKDTTKKILSLENYIDPQKSNSIFLPAKEVLSIYQNIIGDYERYRTFGFDSTYIDLVKALNAPEIKEEKIHPVIKKVITKFEKMIGGKIEFNNNSQMWEYKVKNIKYPISVTAESVKKLGIFNMLLKNGYLNHQSTVFIDEPEVALYPPILSLFLEIISDLAKLGMQFFIVTHSYFVIKKFYLIAQQKKLNIPIAFYEDNKWAYNDLKNEIPNNSIVNEYIKLHIEELGLTFL